MPPTDAPAQNEPPTALSRAIAYIRRRWSLVPIATREKAPKIPNWPALRITEAEAPRYFNGPCNIGGILGEASDGLTDFDLDCDEAIEMAAKVLPATGAVFGRPLRPSSHYLYRVAGGLAPTIKFSDPITGKSLLELRGDGGLQTVLPGSIHPSGDLIEWASDGDPATVDSAVLVEAAKRLAAFCLIRRYFNVGSEASEGGSIPFMITQSQKVQLLERGCTPEQISDMTPIEAQNTLRPAVRDYESLLTALEQCDSRLARCLRDWLGLPEISEAPAPDNDDFLKGPISAYLLDSDICCLPEPLEAALAEGLKEHPTFWSEPIAEECAQLREFRDNAANQGRDSWWPGLGVLAYCVDGDHFAHAWGNVHPKYSFEETQRELDGWRRKADGATRCETFNRKSPGFCERCPHWGKINSPISLGMRWPDQPTTTDAQPAASPRAPEPAATESENVQAPPSTPLIEASSDNGIVRGDELLSTTAPPRRWFVEKFVPAEETTMLGGDGGSGKTTLALQLCVACVSGGKWIGLNVTPRNVLYVSAEDPKGEIHFRLEQITRHAKLSNEELAGFVLFDLAGKDATIATFDRDGRIKPTQLFYQIEIAARHHAVGCIIFDSVADFFGGNENERREVRAFVGLLRGLAMRLDAAVIFLAHPSVDGIKTGRGYSGSTHWNNAVRSRLYFTEAEQEEGQPPNLDLRMIELAKSNRARRGEKIYVVWTDGRFVEASARAAQSVANETEVEELFLTLLSKFNKQGVHVSAHRSPSYAPTVFAKQRHGRDFGKAALERAMHRLIDKERIRVEEHGPPSKRRHRLVIEGGVRERSNAPPSTRPESPEEPEPPTRGGLGAHGGYGGLEGTPVGRPLGVGFAGKS